MTTTLSRFRDAYATLTVATYEPLILRWVSDVSIHVIASTLAWRAAAKGLPPRDRANPTFARLAAADPDRGLPRLTEIPRGAPAGTLSAVTPDGRWIDDLDLTSAPFSSFDDAVRVGDTVLPQGALRYIADAGSGARSRERVRARDDRGKTEAVSAIPLTIDRRTLAPDVDFNFRKERARIVEDLHTAVDTWTSGQAQLATAMRGRLDHIYEFFPVRRIEEFLSPIGIAHFFRQLYFNLEEGVGPLEQALTVAPLEMLEVVVQTVRRQIHEEVLEEGLEEVSEQASEVKNLDEVSDKVSSMIQRDMEASMSANASGTIGVWQAGATASASMNTSTERGRETTTRRLKEMTTRASERITKTFSLTVRDVEEFTTTNMTRRILRNESADPVSFGLRRVLRRVRVKVQDLGPRLVWQLYLRNPGAGLARSKFVHFYEPRDVPVPEIPPGAPPRPQSGTDAGTSSSSLTWDGTRNTWFVSLRVLAGPGRRVTSVTIDSISDLEGGGKDDPAPAPRNNIQWGALWNQATHTYTVNVGVLEGDAASVSVAYTYMWDPDDEAIAAWEAQVDAARAELEEKTLREKFEREKATLTEMSRIRPRPARDLRREERYEVMSRMVSHLFATGIDPSEPSPLEIEYFHRYFDIEMMFTYLHPSWWRPRYTPIASGLGRPAYAVTAESQPAAMGASLGWLIQLDGDERRNAFINSPWIRACIPIRPGRERDAIAWLAEHIEGERGYDPTASPLSDLLGDVERRRNVEDAVGTGGPDWVAVDSAVLDPSNPPDPAKPPGVFPVIDEFDVTVPTEGFVYERLDIQGGP